ESAVKALVDSGSLPAEVLEAPLEVSDTKTPEHGDFACNFALVATKKAGMPPRAIGEMLRGQLLSNSEIFREIDLAGPGFLNLKLKPEAISQYVPRVLAAGDDLGKTDLGHGEKWNVEFVSVNPNGPITVGSGRGAAFGDALCRVLDAAGYCVGREYYINDGLNSQQMRLFAQSVRHYYREALGLPTEFPEKGYRGEYVADVSRALLDRAGQSHGDEPTDWFQKASQDLMIDRQRGDLEAARVVFDTWFSEQSMHDSGHVAQQIDRLKEKGEAYYGVRPEGVETDADEQEEVSVGKEALWLRSSSYGDDKDRVLVRSDGRPAYIAADVAYLQNKFDRGFQKLKLILGPDHHGYIGRMYAACRSLGHTAGHEGEFEIIIYQVVRFVKDGKPAPMRKRDGNIYELRDLISELGAASAPDAPLAEQMRIGADVTRFFYLMRSHETHMDFDIDLATKQSDENPVFYAQYAHARICSVLSKAAEAGITPGADNYSLLTHERELGLIKKILDLPFEVGRCVADYGVHRLTTYATELARTYHHFYDQCRVIQPEEPELTKARVSLCEAARIGLAATFSLLGISAPERM
ncbi:MAG TPA: arginine--tRNA ligase, partial [Fimbriimonas sp.]|nr:arginine--tRNA ligase [Fimbriimonas sp.]